MSEPVWPVRPFQSLSLSPRHWRNYVAHWASPTPQGMPPILRGRDVLLGSDIGDVPLPDMGKPPHARPAATGNLAIVLDGSSERVILKISDYVVRAQWEQEFTNTKISPPALADKLGYFLLSPERQDEVLGDLRERFDQKWLPALGPFGAKCCYLWHVIRVSFALAPSAIIGGIVGYLWKKFGG